MITLQHSLCNLIRYDGNIEQFEKELPLCLLPDAIRYYLGPRPYSHFEQNPEGNDISWYKYPTDIKTLTKEKALNQPKYLAPTSLKSVIGEKIHIDKYIDINRDLPIDEYYGILTHLIQDYIFDEFVNENFDCTNKYEPDAYFDFEGQRYNGQDFRKMFQLFEEYGFYILSYYCYKKYGIVTDQKWFDEHVFNVLKENYPIDLAENTYKYMKIPETIDNRISNRDYSGLMFQFYNIKYNDLYSKVIYYTRNIDEFLDNYNYKTNRSK